MTGGIFQQCTDTIVRQVDDIKRMVDEFSRFARMPKPVMTRRGRGRYGPPGRCFCNASAMPISISTSRSPQDPMPAQFDRRLISQALTNIIKNATEAIAAVPPAELGRGRIRVFAGREGGDIVIDVVDNGIGLPKENRSRLLEPYVTTREKGTGLGLAIVGPHPRGARRPHRAGRRRRQDPGPARRLDAAALCGGSRGRERRPAHAAVSIPSTCNECVTAMAADILIVDDEADIRELVAGILQDEGYTTRTARDSDDALAQVASAPAEPRLSRHLAAGQPARRAAIARCDEGAASRIAGGDDFRPRQHRDRGRRDQAGRLRLHREAVQGRPAGAGRRARAGNVAAQARGQGAQAARAAADSWSASRRR